jgi:hypothetical protein
MTHIHNGILFSLYEITISSHVQQCVNLEDKQNNTSTEIILFDFIHKWILKKLNS